MLYLFAYIDRRHLIASILIILLSFFVGSYTADHVGGRGGLGNRWVFPFFNLVGHRVLVNSEMLKYMKEEGMPINDALMRKKNVWASRKDCNGVGWYNDPELNDFRKWTIRFGKSTYAKFLITHPSYTFGELFSHYAYVLHSKHGPGYYLKGYKTDNILTYSKLKNDFFYKLMISVLIILCALLLVLKKKIFTRDIAVMATLFIPIILLAIITYHGDAMEVSRHTLIIPILVKTTLFMIIYSLGNHLFDKANSE